MTLEKAFENVYQKFNLNFYRDMFRTLKKKDTPLTTVETFCMEIIYAMHNPTVNEFARYISISSPNAAYKVNNLVKKGYLIKVQSLEDKREFHLQVTKKYLDHYDISSRYIKNVVSRIRTQLTKEEQRDLTRILVKISDEIIPGNPRLETFPAENVV